MFFTIKIKSLLIAFVLSLTIYSCASLEDDAKRYGELYCKTEKIAQQMISGEISLDEGKEESERLNKEIQSLSTPAGPWNTYIM